MDSITKEQLERIKPLSGFVLIEVKFNDSVKFKDGTVLKIDTDFNPDQHVPVTGIVYKAPNKLYFNPKDVANSMPWKTEIEIKEGDRVFFDYHAALMALGPLIDPVQEFPEPRYLVVEGKVYVFIMYQDLFFALRDKEIIPLNGFLLCDPIITETKTYGIYLPDHLKKKESNRFAKVFKAGSSNQEYIDKKYRDVREAEENTVVMFLPFANQNVENALHQMMEHAGMAGKKYVAIHRRFVKAVFPEEFVEKVENGSLK